MDTKRIGLCIASLLSVVIVFLLINTGQAQKADAIYRPVIPKTWDERALSDLEVPLADPSRSPRSFPQTTITGFQYGPSTKAILLTTRITNRAVTAKVSNKKSPLCFGMMARTDPNW